tara:strand:+ start:903 stop:1163 length:261 start_codon:yes stop_codon:yes gene_type:complete
MIKVFCFNWKDKKHKEKKSEMINLEKVLLKNRSIFIGNCKICHEENLIFILGHPTNIDPNDVTVENHTQPNLFYRACLRKDQKWMD